MKVSERVSQLCFAISHSLSTAAVTLITRQHFLIVCLSRNKMFVGLYEVWMC